MEHEELITLETICSHYGIEITFVQSLKDYGLIEIVQVTEGDCLHKNDLGELERLMNLHYDLHVNMEGLDVIHHLLYRVKDMQKEITLLKNRLGHL